MALFERIKTEITIEKTLIERLKNHERDALEELYQLYAPSLLAVSIRYTTNKHDAEDVVHDAFIKILKNIHQFVPRFEGAFEAWMKRITVNTSINFLRKKAKLTEFNGNIYDEGAIPDTDNENPADMPHRIEPEAAIRMVSELPPGYRLVMNLYVFENYSHKEIADELNISINTSKSQLSKARALLRKKVAQYYKRQQIVE